MGQYILVTGIHIGPDPDWKPTDEDRERAKTMGTALRRPSKQYTQGQTVESETDLVARHGAKFAYAGAPPQAHSLVAGQGQPGALPGDPTAANLLASPSVAPGGQVSSGFQQASGRKEGGTVSGPLDPARLPQAREAAVPAPAQAPAPAAGSNLEDLSVSELRDLAAEEEIPLHGAKSKDELVRAIKGARKRG